MSEGFFATAEVLVRPNTADFAAALKAQVAAAIAVTGPFVIPIAAAPVVTGPVAGKGAAAAAAAELAVVNEDAAVAALGLTSATKLLQDAETRGLPILGATTAALDVQSGALTKTAVAEEAAAGAAVTHAKAAGQAERAIFAQSASIAGLRGAALTASAPFLAATVAIIAFGKSIREASNQTEELNKSAVVFGASAKTITDFAKTTASSLGISEVEALRAAGIFGNLFRTIHISTPAAADMSTQLVKLASDLASFNNADPARVLEALRSGLVGQARPLRVFGIFISQARAQQEALIETGKKNVKELTNSELVQARFNIILKDSTLAQGDFARTSDRLANQSRILKANLADTAVTIGSVLVPALSRAAVTANDYLTAIQKAAKVTDDFAASVHLAASKEGGPSFLAKVFHTATGSLLDSAKALVAAGEVVSRGKLIKFGEAPTKTLRDLNAAAERSKESLPAVSGRIETLFESFGKAGGRGSETALNAFVLGLKKLEEEESKGLVTNDQLAARIRNLIKQLQDPSAFKINLGVTLDQAGLQQKATQGAHAVVGALSDVLSPQAGNAIGLNFLLGVGTGIDTGTKTAKAKAAGAGAVIAEQIALAEASGNQGAELQGLRTLAARQKAFLDRIKARPQTAANVDTATKAANQLAATNSKIESITNGIVADQKAAAADAKSKAKDAQDSRDNQFQALADMFGGRQQKIEDAISRAGIAGNLNKEIRLNKALVTAALHERKVLLDRLKNLKVSASVRKTILQAINRAIESAQEEGQRLAAEQKKNAADRQQALLDFQQSHLEAVLSIAETTKSTKDDERALKAIIALDNARIAALKKKRKKTLEEKTELDNLRVDLAQRNKALKDLQGVTEDANKAAAKFFFEQLQAQQGFASNLLGNLITGSTAGLVGVPSPAAAAKAAGAIPEDRIASERTRQQAKTTPGPTAGQHQTTNDILIRILHALTRQNRTDQAPEAHHQRRVGAAIMDNDGIHGI